MGAIRIFWEKPFESMGISILRGRNFAPHDGQGSPAVAIISEAMAERFWGAAKVIGRSVLLGRAGEPVEIIGVARDTVVRSPGEAPLPYLYLPFSQLLVYFFLCWSNQDITC